LAAVFGALDEESQPEYVSFAELSGPDYVTELLDCAELVESRLVQPLLCDMIEHRSFEVIFLGTALEVRHQSRVLILLILHIKVDPASFTKHYTPHRRELCLFHSLDVQSSPCPLNHLYCGLRRQIAIAEPVHPAIFEPLTLRMLEISVCE